MRGTGIIHFPLTFTAIMLVALCWPGAAAAHKVNIYAYAGDGMIYSESYFASGTRCSGCSISVFDNITGEKLLEGKTDSKGMFSFQIPSEAELKLTLKTGSGHGNSYIISLDEIREALGMSESMETSDSAAAGAAQRISPAELPETQTGAPDAAGSPTEIDMASLEKVVEQKIEPMMREIGKIREDMEKPRVAEILGGIGYIIGLLGLWAILKNRKITVHRDRGSGVRRYK